jgi:hypothetical protein
VELERRQLQKRADQIRTIMLQASNPLLSHLLLN